MKPRFATEIITMTARKSARVATESIADGETAEFISHLPFSKTIARLLAAPSHGPGILGLLSMRPPKPPHHDIIFATLRRPSLEEPRPILVVRVTKFSVRRCLSRDTQRSRTCAGKCEVAEVLEIGPQPRTRLPPQLKQNMHAACGFRSEAMRPNRWPWEKTRRRGAVGMYLRGSTK
jgi:hypothetical protein